MVSEDKLAELSRSGVVPKPVGGFYELAPTVQAYVRHCRELDEVASHAQMGKLVGVSKQAIQKKAKEIGLDNGLPLREWLFRYSEYQRSIASGRAGDSDKQLTTQRIEESKQKTLALTLDNMERVGLLVPAEDAGAAIDEVVNIVTSKHDDLGNKIIESISSRYKIELDDECVFEPIGSALASIAKNARELSDDFKGRVGESDS